MSFQQPSFLVGASRAFHQLSGASCASCPCAQVGVEDAIVKIRQARELAAEPWWKLVTMGTFKETKKQRKPVHTTKITKADKTAKTTKTTKAKKQRNKERETHIRSTKEQEPTKRQTKPKHNLQKPRNNTGKQLHPDFRWVFQGLKFPPSDGPQTIAIRKNGSPHGENPRRLPEGAEGDLSRGGWQERFPEQFLRFGHKNKWDFPKFPESKQHCLASFWKPTKEVPPPPPPPPKKTQCTDFLSGTSKANERATEQMGADPYSWPPNHGQLFLMWLKYHLLINPQLANIPSLPSICTFYLFRNNCHLLIHSQYAFPPHHGLAFPHAARGRVKPNPRAIPWLLTARLLAGRRQALGAHRRAELRNGLSSPVTNKPRGFLIMVS